MLRCLCCPEIIVFYAWVMRLYIPQITPAGSSTDWFLLKLDGDSSFQVAWHVGCACSVIHRGVCADNVLGTFLWHMLVVPCTRYSFSSLVFSRAWLCDVDFFTGEVSCLAGAGWRAGRVSLFCFLFALMVLVYYLPIDRCLQFRL